MGSLCTAGIVVTALAFVGFDRTYHYIPDRLVVALGMSLAAFIAIGLHAGLYPTEGKARRFAIVALIAALVGLGASSLVLIIPVFLLALAHALAAILISANLSTSPSERRILAYATAGSLLLLLPGADLRVKHNGKC